MMPLSLLLLATPSAGHCGMTPKGQPGPETGTIQWVALGWPARSSSSAWRQTSSFTRLWRWPSSATSKGSGWFQSIRRTWAGQIRVCRHQCGPGHLSAQLHRPSGPRQQLSVGAGLVLITKDPHDSGGQRHFWGGWSFRAGPHLMPTGGTLGPFQGAVATTINMSSWATTPPQPQLIQLACANGWLRSCFGICSDLHQSSFGGGWLSQD